jgi:iron complex transport system substrate-binding protein
MKTSRPLTADVENRPTVFLSSPYQGTWYMSPGGSYTARLLEDAGADYLWAEDEGAGVLVLDFESVLERAADADVWLNPDQLFWFSLDDVVTTDERFVNFTAYENGMIYNNNARLNESGWNDYYESGVANPDVVLADLIAIFHPDLLLEHELYYYRQLEGAE